MRLIIVSNRLPLIIFKEQDKLEFKESSGGLVSGISSYLDTLKSSEFVKPEYLWVGWPGISVEEKDKSEIEKKLLKKFNIWPVYISEQEMESFYQGFCNKTIWPLFHYFPSYATYNEKYWDSYEQVNKYFFDRIIKILQPDDIVWIHDYHLMLLPNLLREKYSELTIGFFLHIPFPEYEIFRLLPNQWGQNILNGILGADLIGFHTNDYTQYFLRCILRILGCEHNLGKVIYKDRIIKVDTFPMGIDFKKFHNSVDTSIVQEEIQEIKKSLSELKIIFSVDRLDYTKGVLNRLQGYELFLETNVEWHKKIVFLLIIVPSRIGIDQYQEMKTKIEEYVGKINGKFGSLEWTPLVYQYRHIPFHSLVALYNISDIALITPLRDGMNLVAKEYLSSKPNHLGVLVLSEMAGAVKELGEAVIVNPNHKEDIAKGIKDALGMLPEEQMERNKIMQQRLENYDVVHWAEEFIKELTDIKTEQKKFSTRILSANIKTKLLSNFISAKQKLIFVDYDGTLVPFTQKPDLAKPDIELVSILSSIAENADLVLISGRNKETLQNWFGNLDISLVAEHGIWIKEKNADWQLLKPISSDWKPKLIPLLRWYVDRVPRSFVEEKEFSIVWHYRKSDAELASIRAKELIDELVHFTANIDVQILQGSKVVEIRNTGINKGSAGLYFLSKNNYDFILAIGDDWTDEDLFKVLPENAFSIKVGLTSSYAKYNLYNYVEVRNFLKNFYKNEKNYV